MTNLVFECVDAAAERFAVSPTLALKLQVAETTGEQIHAVALRCQIRIAAQQRRYSAAEAERLLELFGETARWGETLKPLHFTNLSLMVPGFVGSTTVDLPVPCTYDFEVAATKFLHALDEGEIPLLLLFSGTIFYKRESGFAVEQVPWHKEATFRLPVRVWREMMDLYFPNSGWIRMHRDTLDALLLYKARRALPTWDQTIAALLAAGEREP